MTKKPLTDEELSAIMESADIEASLELANHPERECLGFIHTFWGRKKQILKEKHGIDWQSPADFDIACYD
jgi:hypothetical protein